MTKAAWRWLGLALAIGVATVWLVLSGGGRHGVRDIASGTGFSAQELCTRTLLSGEAFDHVRTEYVEPTTESLSRIWQLDFRPGARVAVSTRLPFLSNTRVAVFRPGLGCTIIPPGTSEAAVLAQPFARAAELAPDERAWPLGEATAESGLLSDAERAIIERVAPKIFAETTRVALQRQHTTALLIARDGHLVFERYGEGYTRQRPQLGWSMTKSLTAIIAGLLAHDGKLQVDAPVGLRQWQGTPKAAITWRNLLNMAPGLAWDEGYKGASDATEMLFSQANEGAWAADRPLTSIPGKVFNYSTGSATTATLAMRELLGGTHQALYDYYQRQLFAPLGIRYGVIEPDASGTPVGGARGVLRPVDWLRLGQLVANGGTWYGRTMLDAAYLKFMTEASPASAAYGGSVWRLPCAMFDARLRETLPADLVMFAGHMGQLTIIVPSRRLVVVRMGVSLAVTMQVDPTRDRVFALVSELLAAR